MSAIASVLAAMGHVVTGSDLKTSPALERLGASGVKVVVGHDAAHVAGRRGGDGVDRHPRDEPRGRRGPPSWAHGLEPGRGPGRHRRPSACHRRVGDPRQDHHDVDAGADPHRGRACARAFSIGGDVNEIGTNAVWDSGEWLVLEADESDGTFLHLAPEVAVVTNVEPDHLDYYGDFDHLVDAFDRFVPRGPGVRSWVPTTRWRRVWGAPRRGSGGQRARGHLPDRGSRDRRRRVLRPARGRERPRTACRCR